MGDRKQALLLLQQAVLQKDQSVIYVGAFPALLFDPSFFVFDFAPNRELTKFLLVDENVLEQGLQKSFSVMEISLENFPG